MRVDATDRWCPRRGAEGRVATSAESGAFRLVACRRRTRRSVAWGLWSTPPAMAAVKMLQNQLKSAHLTSPLLSFSNLMTLAPLATPADVRAVPSVYT